MCSFVRRRRNTQYDHAWYASTIGMKTTAAPVMILNVHSELDAFVTLSPN